MKPVQHTGHGGAKMKLRPDIKPFWQADPSLPRTDDHDDHVERVLAALAGGFPVMP